MNIIMTFIVLRIIGEITFDLRPCVYKIERFNALAMAEKPDEGLSTKAKKRAGACSNYLEGRARKVHKLRHDVEIGLKEGASHQPEEPSNSRKLCTDCKPVLEKLLPKFESFVRSDIELRHRKRVLPNPRKPDKLHYRNLVAQNEWIRCNLFDALGNYRYCQVCITNTLGIGTQRLTHQRSVKRRQTLIPLLPMTKSDIISNHLEESVVMPEGQDNFKKWWPTLMDTDIVNVHYPHESHGLARKPSNSAKLNVREQFLQFVDVNSQPNGRQSGSYGALFYFLPKFTRIGEPKKSEKNYTDKVEHSLLCEFNRVQEEEGRGKCSERSAFRWLKEDRPRHAICPPRTDYCDRCKELKEEMNRQKTVLQRLRHVASCSDTELLSHERLQEEAAEKLIEHKRIAQKALEHYRFTVEKCGKDWTAINDLNASARLNQLEESFELVLSADYQMTKLIPHWGYSDQPGISYYLRKVSHDLFGIVDHRDESKYVAIFDEQVGPKNSDHTVSILRHYIRNSGRVPNWIRRVCIFLDNATSTNKNRYVIGWAMELVQQKELDYIRIAFLITGHTKFAPDRVFASIGNSYIHSDVFNIEDLVSVASSFCTAMEEKGETILHWREKLDEKYTELHGIRQYHDFVVNRNAEGNAQLQVRERCDSGTFKLGSLKVRRDYSPQTVSVPQPSSNYLISKRPLSAEKLSDMNTMYSRFIDPEKWPYYIVQTQRGETQGGAGPNTQTTSDVVTKTHGKTLHCSTPGCDGTGHKNTKRWSGGHTTRAGCPIYHGVSGPR